MISRSLSNFIYNFIKKMNTCYDLVRRSKLSVTNELCFVACTILQWNSHHIYYNLEHNVFLCTKKIKILPSPNDFLTASFLINLKKKNRSTITSELLYFTTYWHLPSVELEMSDSISRFSLLDCVCPPLQIFVIFV